MSGISVRRRLASLLLAAVVLVPWAASAAPRAAVEACTVSSSPRLFAQLRSLLTSLWSEAGCILDPDGRCTSTQSTTSAPPVSPDAGRILDPNVGCAGSN